MTINNLNLLSKYISKSENDTIQYAIKLANKLKPYNVLVLSGDLGVGKTRFVFGVANYFGMSNQISSPTFTIVNEYASPKKKNDINTIFHFDVYRLQNAHDFETTIGLDYFSTPNSISIVEWGEVIQEVLPSNTIYITITRIDETIREISIYTKGDENDV